MVDANFGNVVDGLTGRPRMNDKGETDEPSVWHCRGSADHRLLAVNRFLLYAMVVFTLIVGLAAACGAIKFIICRWIL